MAVRAIVAPPCSVFSASVLLVDRDPLVLDQLRDTLGGGGYRILAATAAEEALRLVGQGHIDLALIDANVEGGDGLDIAVDIRRVSPEVIVILTTATPCIASAMRAINEAQVHRYLTKPCNRDVLCMVVRDVLQLRAQPPAPPFTTGGLSPRLRQMLDALMTGASEKQIADQLGISPHTAHQYVKAVFRRFGVTSRAELMAKALRRQQPRLEIATRA
jgi:DNA-binding NarL/FixJ family response regulator